eukprot:2423699-Pyramimonas_sp.AAC.1
MAELMQDDGEAFTVEAARKFSEDYGILGGLEVDTDTNTGDVPPHVEKDPDFGDGGEIRASGVAERPKDYHQHQNLGPPSPGGGSPQ